MAISYRRLWKLLIDRDLRKMDLQAKAGLSSSTIAKLGQNKTVKSDVIDRICTVLECDVGDIMEIEVFDAGKHTDSQNNNDAYSVVSLFSGCGGLDLGFLGGFNYNGTSYEKHPFRIVWANEINKAACATYRNNIDSGIIEGPIEKHFTELPLTADVLIGGFPCQDISINGKMAGVDGKRSGLYVWMVKAVAKLRPKVFIAENVKALLLKRHQQSLERVVSDFSELGYNVTYQLYDAADYGVPQYRERVIIVGVRSDITTGFVPPAPTTKNAHVTSSSVLADLENMPYDAESNHIWSEAKPSSGQGLRFISANEPATTIRSECHGNIQFHYSLPRRLSMREAARLQSFPDSFTFHAKLRESERMIGNAVAPVFAWHIAGSVLDVLNNASKALLL